MGLFSKKKTSKITDKVRIVNPYPNYFRVSGTIVLDTTFEISDDLKERLNGVLSCSRQSKYSLKFGFRGISFSIKKHAKNHVKGKIQEIKRVLKMHRKGI